MMRWLLWLAMTADAQCLIPVWTDEFTGDRVDPSKWSFQTGAGGWGNQELQYYTDRPLNAEVREGLLRIVARAEDFGGSRYTSARLRTINKGDWTYGRFEVRMRLPVARGLWPAFWMMPTDAVYGGWPRSGEIDIMELVGTFPSRVYGTIHSVNSLAAHTSSGGFTDLTQGTFADGFHVFALDWEPGRIRWSLDGREFLRREVPLPDFLWRFDQRFHLILNVAVGGQWPGPPNETTTFPQAAEIDWVRVSQAPDHLRIAGPDRVEPFTPGAVYRLPAVEGVTYTWKLPDGSTQTGPEARVDWQAESGVIEASIETACGTATAKLPVTVSTNLWRNAGFEDGYAHWSQRGDPDVRWFINRLVNQEGEQAARIAILRTTPNPWDIQLTRRDVELEQGRSYRVSFLAKANWEGKRISAAVIDARDFSSFLNQTIELSGVWQRYAYTFTARASAPGLFNLDLGRDMGTYDFDDFTWERL